MSYSTHFSFFTYYHCFVVFFPPLLFVCIISVWFVLSSSWDHSPRCHWPCLAELCEKDAEALRSLPHSWPSRGSEARHPKRGGSPRGQAEGDNNPQHCSVDQGKIFILLFPKQKS